MGDQEKPGSRVSDLGDSPQGAKLKTPGSDIRMLRVQIPPPAPAKTRHLEEFSAASPKSRRRGVIRGSVPVILQYFATYFLASSAFMKN